MAQTATQTLASHLLQRPVNEWIAEQRAQGMSYTGVMLRLREETGLTVTGETIRRWLDTPAVERAS